MRKVIRFFALAGGLLLISVCRAQTVYIPQIADGGGWQTTLVLTNATAAPSAVTLSFRQQVDAAGNTQPWNLSFVEGSAQGLSIPSGTTTYLHTLGTSANTTTGWGAITGAGVTAYAIFTQRVPGRQDQDGTVPAGFGAPGFLVPFDDTDGATTAIAIVNLDDSSTAVWVGGRTSDGATSPRGEFRVPAQGHLAFALQDSQIGSLVKGKSGLAEIISYVAAAKLSVVALRFNKTSSFTAAPVYAESGSPIVGGEPPINRGFPSYWFIRAYWSANGNSEPMQIQFDCIGVSTCWLQIFQPPDSLNQKPLLWASIVCDLNGQTLTTSQHSLLSGFYGNSPITAVGLTLTVSNFVQMGASVTGNLTFASGPAIISGLLTGTASYLP